jgi:pyruvate dehydrogenase E1 component alpha subunit
MKGTAVQRALKPSGDMIQVLAPDGTYDEEQEPRLSDETLKSFHRFMLLTRAFDDRALKLQRQGRIGFFVPSTGEEAVQVGSAFAFEPQDWFFPAYREQGAAFVRGLTPREVMCQLFGNSIDLEKGRQMPNHFGKKEIHFVPTSSPVATQLPHAVGAAYGAKYRREPTVVATYFGDGGTSTGDFHAAMNFAGVWRAPVVFICKNNQWAISAPLRFQTASETLAVKAVAYGLPGVRVDGNDVLAVYKVTREAAERARAGQGPTLIEAVTYRLGPHSSSDDPKRYRSDREVEEWKRKDPLQRFEAYLRSRGLLDDSSARRVLEEVTAEVSDAVEYAEAHGPPALDTLFTDVYGDMPWQLVEGLEDARRWHGNRGGG